MIGCDFRALIDLVAKDGIDSSVGMRGIVKNRRKVLGWSLVDVGNSFERVENIMQKTENLILPEKI